MDISTKIYLEKLKRRFQIKGIIISAPTSGAGKTIFTLGLLRALRKRLYAVYPAKSGPDYIDPLFHHVASGRPSLNLDGWAMNAGLVKSLANVPSKEGFSGTGDILLVEGAMGILDGGGKGGRGCVADLAELLSLPVILVVDASKQFHSVALAPLGLINARPETKLLGVILNRIGSTRHLTGAKESLETHGVRLLGWIPNKPEFNIPERHLGLVLPSENPEIEEFIEMVSDQIEATVQIEAILNNTSEVTFPGKPEPHVGIKPLGQNIAVAHDKAFAFLYTHLINYWRDKGAKILPFSPLADEGPDAEADAVFLPGGYPELHLPKLTGNAKFLADMNNARARNALIYGECGGFMVLGDAIEDSKGESHRMLGFLKHVTSFQKPKLQLGYRRFAALPNPIYQGKFLGHEFHYSALKVSGGSKNLFQVEDSFGNKLPEAGLVEGNVFGSYNHLICASQEE